MRSRLPLYDAEALGALCSACPFNDPAHPPTPPELKAPAARALTIVLEGPGYVESAVGVPLSGRSGAFMDDVFTMLGISRNNVSILNSTACLPKGNPGPKEFRAAVECCRPRLERELEAQALRPKEVIIAMGAAAVSSLCGHRPGGIVKWRGYPLPALNAAFAHTTILPTLHPAFVLREPAYWPILKVDVRRALALADGANVPSPKRPRIVIGNHEDTYKELIALHERATDIGLDVETGGTNWFEAPLLCIGVADSECAISIPVQHDEQVGKALRDLLADPAVGKVLQNRNVDLIALRVAGYEVSERSPKNFDLLDASRIAFPDVEHGLGELVSYFMFVPRWKSHYHAGKDKGEDSWLKDSLVPEKFKAMMEYNALDAYYTVMLKPYLMRALADMEGGR